MSSRARGIVVSVVWLFVLQFFDYMGWFAAVNGKIIDPILRVHSSGPESPASQHIYVIEIDDEAYESCFHHQSPMDPRRVFNLVKEIAEANPKAIAVDIHTEEPQYSDWIHELAGYASSIVWVSDYATIKQHVAPFPAWLTGARDDNIVTPRPVLGMAPFTLPRSRQTNWGIALYARDEDGRIRRFPRTVSVAANDIQGHGSAPSWAARVGDVYCGDECTAESADEIYISYAGTEPTRYKMLDLFGCPNGPGDSHRLELLPNWNALRGQLLGKLVLVGATFRGSSYPTPKRDLPGLIVNAYAVKAELDGNGLEEVRQPLAWMLDLALGLLIVFICDEKSMQRLDQFRALSFVSGWKRKKIVLSTAVVIAVCVASLFVAKGRYLLGFGGEGAGVLVDRLRDLWDFTEPKPSRRRP